MGLAAGNTAGANSNAKLGLNKPPRASSCLPIEEDQEQPVGAPTTNMMEVIGINDKH